MDQYSIGIALPEAVRKRLAMLCFGLPHVHWMESSFFHISLKPLGPLDHATLIDIANALQELSYHSFFLNLQGINAYAHNHKTKTIGASLSASIDIDKLKNLINSTLHGIKTAEKKRDFTPHIPLGIAQVADKTRLDLFLLENSTWHYSPLHVKSLALFRIHSTPKHIFSEVIAEFPLK